MLIYDIPNSIFARRMRADLKDRLSIFMDSCRLAQLSGYYESASNFAIHPTNSGQELCRANHNVVTAHQRCRMKRVDRAKFCYSADEDRFYDATGGMVMLADERPAFFWTVVTHLAQGEGSTAKKLSHRSFRTTFESFNLLGATSTEQRSFVRLMNDFRRDIDLSTPAPAMPRRVSRDCQVSDSPSTAFEARLVRRYSDPIDTLIEAMEQSARLADPTSIWSSIVEVAVKSYHSRSAPTWATCALINSYDDERPCDVMYVKEIHLEPLLEQRPLEKVTIVLDHVLPKRHAMKDFDIEFCGRLPTEPVDIQDYSTFANNCSNTDPATMQIPSSELVRRIQHTRQRKSSGQMLDLYKNTPLNCLNLGRWLHQAIPSFLWLKDLLILEEACHSPDMGKENNVAIEEFRDIAACQYFTLYAQAGAISGFHADILCGTWVRCLGPGAKAWVMVTDPSDAELDELNEQGPWAWVPRAGRAKIVVLKPGEVLLMPPGMIILHAPLTLDECLLDGGMYWDGRCIPKILDAIRRLCLRPRASNESVPSQLPELLAAIHVNYNQRQKASDYALSHLRTAQVAIEDFLSIVTCSRALAANWRRSKKKKKRNCFHNRVGIPCPATNQQVISL